MLKVPVSLTGIKAKNTHTQNTMKKMIITALVAAQVLCLPQTAMAEPEESMSEAQQNLEDTNSEIRELKGKQEVLQREANELDGELAALLIEIETTKSDIEEKTDEVAAAQADLVVAEEKEADHKGSMEVRIQYMYENSGTGFLVSLFSGGSFADVINRVELANTLYKKDRELLNEYTEAKEEADEARERVEEEKKELEELEETLEEQQGDLEARISEKDGEITDVTNELIELEQLAGEYQQTITALNAAIEAENARAAQRAAQLEIETTYTATVVDAPEVSSYDEISVASEEEVEEGEDGKDINTIEETASLGQQVADYACQFVGGPYVWGGTSLTNGCDCSGFIMSVYANFGVSLPHYSGSLRSVGYEVSESELMPGDIICFSGHCAIYIGNNQIVHAQSSATGIVISSYPYHKTTLARRRIF